VSDFEEKKKEILNPLFFEAGAALHDCQGFELGIAILLLHLGRMGAIGLRPEKIFDVLDNKDKKTVGQLISMLHKHVKVSEKIEKNLSEALTARNQLIHRVLVDNVEGFLDSEARELLIKKIRKLRSKVQKGDGQLRPFINAFSEALDGVEQSKIEQEVKALFN
jgi:hypothetical protein